MMLVCRIRLKCCLVDILFRCINVFMFFSSENMLVWFLSCIGCSFLLVVVGFRLVMLFRCSVL